MFRSIVLVAVVCGLASAVPSIPWSQRYGFAKTAMPGLLVTPPGQSHCQLISGLLNISTSVNFTVTQQTTFTAWVNSMEVIVNNASITNQTDKFNMIAASMRNFSMDTSSTNGSGIYGMMKYTNISTWGCCEQFLSLTNEINFQASLQVVVASDTSGNCALFDSLLFACTDAPKKAALQAFINQYLKPLVKQGMQQTDLIVAINNAFTNTFFVQNPTWKQWFMALSIAPGPPAPPKPLGPPPPPGPGPAGPPAGPPGPPVKPFSFGQFFACGATFQQQQMAPTIMAGSNTTCPFIQALNATLYSSSYTNTQKGTISIMMKAFQSQWSVSLTYSARIQWMSMEFTQMCDTSPSYFALLNSIQIPGFSGGLFEMVSVSCQINIIPTSCGCPVPVAPMMTTTEMPSTTKCSCKCEM